MGKLRKFRRGEAPNDLSRDAVSNYCLYLSSLLYRDRIAFLFSLQHSAPPMNQLQISTSTMYDGEYESSSLLYPVDRHTQRQIASANDVR